MVVRLKAIALQRLLLRSAHYLFVSGSHHSTVKSRLLSSTPAVLSQQDLDAPDVRAVFHVISTSPSPESMRESLAHSSVFLSNDLIDAVLKRVRFAHAEPLRALDFFLYTSERRGFYHSPISIDTLLYVLGRSRRFDKCWDVLRHVHKKDSRAVTTRTLQVVLGRAAKVCSVRMTVGVFWKFRKLFSAGEFGTPCFNALLRSMCQEKSMVDARNVYHRLKRQFHPDIQTFNILLSGWKSSEEAERFLDEMKELGVKPDLVSYNCLIDVYCKNREVDKALKLVDKMRDEEIYPDVITYTSLIGGLGLVGQPDKARDLLKDMKEYGCHPDVAAYNAAIRNFCIAKRLGDAFSLMDEMGGKGLPPNAVSFNLFFRCFYWSNDLRSAWNLYRRMRADSCLPNTQSCMFLIRLSHRHENVPMALELWNDMVTYEFGSFVLVSDVLFDLLCDMGKLIEAERCFVQMVDKGQKPSYHSFRRIKILMELANNQDSIRNLSQKMAGFGNKDQPTNVDRDAPP